MNDIVCVHKTFPLPRYSLEEPQRVFCKRCDVAWAENDPEPRVVIARVESVVI